MTSIEVNQPEIGPDDEPEIEQKQGALACVTTGRKGARPRISVPIDDADDLFEALHRRLDFETQYQLTLLLIERFNLEIADINERVVAVR